MSSETWRKVMKEIRGDYMKRIVLPIPVPVKPMKPISEEPYLMLPGWSGVGMSTQLFDEIGINFPDWLDFKSAKVKDDKIVITLNKVQ